MKKKIGIGIGIFLILLIIVGIITNYADSGRVSTGHEPKYCIKVVSNDGSKVTYWGLGYKVIRYVGVSPNEPYENNIGTKMGSWFMNYELPKSNTIEIEYEGQKITITDIKDIGTIENILLNSKYDGEICDGINTHKIVLNNEVYYIKESCKEIQKGNKQATISTEDLSTIKSIIDNKINDEQNNTKSNRSSENVTIEINNSTIKPESVSITITDNNENQYGWGVEFRVQEKVDGEWKNLNYISDELSWIDIAYELNEDKQLTQKLDIEKYYGKLPNGIYRIVKPVYDNGYIDIYSNEFEIK